MVSVGVSFSQASLIKLTRVEGLRTLGGRGNRSTTVGGAAGGGWSAVLSIVRPRISNEDRGGSNRSTNLVGIEGRL